MTTNTYYTDHWVEIEDERIARYNLMFAWHPGQAPLLEPAGIAEGQTVLDFGSGPGHLTRELARRTGPSGHVHGVDVNAAFVEKSQQSAAEEEISEHLTFHHVESGADIPLADASIDRVICKNVLEYVPDLASTLAEFHRVLRVGGRVHIIDSDWGFVVVEPWSPAKVTEFFDAAAPAFKEPNIGRKLPGALRETGFTDLSLQLQPVADMSGASMILLQNMVSYVRACGLMEEERLTALLAELQTGIEKEKYLFILPQFLVTAKK